eukprot:561908-Prorocentrum_minimum.AAC.1
MPGEGVVPRVPGEPSGFRRAGVDCWVDSAAREGVPPLPTPDQLKAHPRVAAPRSTLGVASPPPAPSPNCSIRGIVLLEELFY